MQNAPMEDSPISADRPLSPTGDRASGPLNPGAGDPPASVEPRKSETVRAPDFVPLRESRESRVASGVDRFYDVHVPVWVELGRIEMTLGDLLKLGEGSVLRLERPISEPVDLVSQGVKLARGEVVVIEDCFGIRIKEIESHE
jgi:flagellar motor switch protein FliN/FliY